MGLTVLGIPHDTLIELENKEFRFILIQETFMNI